MASTSYVVQISANSGNAYGKAATEHFSMDVKDTSEVEVSTVEGSGDDNVTATRNGGGNFNFRESIGTFVAMICIPILTLSIM